jgi:anti-sigma-K factor RskA
VAAYDPARQALIVTSLMKPGEDPAHVHELWVIPADGKPRSLGVVPDKVAAAMTVRPEHRAMLAEGVTLALSLEPEGGSPTGQPTGPVVMTGVMSAV